MTSEQERRAWVEKHRQRLAALPPAERERELKKLKDGRDAIMRHLKAQDESTFRQREADLKRAVLDMAQRKAQEAAAAAAKVSSIAGASNSRVSKARDDVLKAADAVRKKPSKESIERLLAATDELDRSQGKKPAHRNKAERERFIRDAVTGIGTAASPPKQGKSWGDRLFGTW